MERDTHHSLLEGHDTHTTLQYVVEKEPHNVTWRVRPFQGSHSLLVAVGIPIILFSLYRVIMRLNCSIVQGGGGALRDERIEENVRLPAV